jgi:hypothetical protein
MIENIQIHMSRLSLFFFFFSFFLGLKFWTNVKNKYETKIFDHFFNFKVMLQHFPIWFLFGNNVSMFR